MRILLIATQAVLLTLVAVAAALATMLGGVIGTAGTGVAAAVGGLMVIGMALAAAAVGLVAFALPIALSAGLTLIFAVAAGYRPLRWSRFVGMAVNLGSMAYFLILHTRTDLVGLRFLLFMLTLPAVNCLLFLFMPRRPSYRLTRAVVAVGVPLLYILPYGWMIHFALTGMVSSILTDKLFFVAIFLVCAIPFYFVFRAIPFTASVNAALGKRLLILSGVAFLAQAVFPFGIPLGLATLLLLLLTEISLLHPEEPPVRGGAHFWAARVLGTLPADVEVATAAMAGAAPATVVVGGNGGWYMARKGEGDGIID